MKPELESLAQQLIEAAPRRTAQQWCQWKKLASPENITAVILAFRDELAQGKSEHGKTLLLLNQAAFETIPKLQEELKQARRDALSDAIGAIQRAAMHRSVQLHYKCATDAIRALMEKP